MKELKRVLSLFVALVMCLSVMSLPAFADYDGDEAAQIETLPGEATPTEETTSEEPQIETPAAEPEAAQVQTTETTTEETSTEPEQGTEDENAVVSMSEGEITGSVGDTVQVTVDGASEDAEISYSSSDPWVARVDEDGNVSIVGDYIEGDTPAVIEATITENGETRTEQVVVNVEEKAESTEEELAALEAAESEAARLAAEQRWPKSEKTLVFDTENYRVTVSVPESAFAEAVYFRVIEMQWAELDDATAELLKANGMTEDDALLDIGFEDGDGFEVEPDTAIGVTIEASEAEIAEVYHVEDAETVAKVAEDGEAFEVEGFSIFVFKVASENKGYVELDTSRGTFTYDANGYDSADAALRDAVQVAEAGDTIKLLEDVTLSSRLEVSTALTLDLNGKTLSTNNPNIWGVVVSCTDGNLTITDSSAELDNNGYETKSGTGKIVTASDGGYDCAVGADGGNVIINAGTFMAYYWTVDNWGSGSITVNGGTISACEIALGAENWCTNGSITINGGIANSWNGWTLQNNSRSCTFSVYGGTVQTSSSSGLLWSNGAPFLVTGGIFRSNGTIEIFSNYSGIQPQNGYSCYGTEAIGYNCAYEVKATPSAYSWAARTIISVGGEDYFAYYNTVEQAFWAVPNAGTVQLNQYSFKEFSEPVVVRDKSVTFDLNGNQYYATSGKPTNPQYCIKIESGAALTITNLQTNGSATFSSYWDCPIIYCKGTVVLEGSSLGLYNNTNSPQSEDCCVLYVADGGNAIIRGHADCQSQKSRSVIVAGGGTLTAGTEPDNPYLNGISTGYNNGNAALYIAQNGTATLNGGSFYSYGTAIEVAGTLTVNNGTVKSESNVTDEGVAIVVNGGTATINGGDINSLKLHAVTVENSGRFVNNGGRITNFNESQSYGVSTNSHSNAIINVESGSVARIESGLVGVVSNRNGEYTSSNPIVTGAGTLYVTGGTIATAAIRDGSSTGTVQISGGLFNINIDESLLGLTSCVREATGTEQYRVSTWYQVVPMYEITLETAGGIGVPSYIYCAKDETIGSPTPSKTGYTFNGWSPAVSAVTGDAGLNNLKTNPSIDGVKTTTQVAYGAIPTPANPTKDGYTFTGWSPALTAVTGSVTYTAQFVANASAKTETKTEGTTTTVTTTTEGEFKPTDNPGEQQKVDSTVTTKTENDGSTTKKTETVEATTTTEKVEGATLTVTVETTTVTTTTTTPSGGSASVNTTADSKETVTTVAVKAADSAATLDTSKVTSSTEVTALATNAPTNEVTTANVNVAKLAKEVYDKVAADKNIDTETADVEVTVSLTLQPTLTAVEADSLTFDVKPIMTATVKVGDEVKSSDYITGDDKVVDNSMLTGSITVKLPVPESFIPADLVPGTSTLQVKHTKEDNTVEILTGTICREGTEGSYTYYVRFETESFSSFELIPAGKVFRTVTFDSNGGSAVANQVIASGSAATQPSAPTRNGYTFNGWTLSGCTYDFASAVSSDITLVASWTQNSTPTYYGGGGGGSTSTSTQQPQTTIEDEETPLSEFPIFYVDVADDSWYHDAIAYVSALGLMNGVGDSKFDPNVSSTRGMVATILMRLANGESIDLDSFYDVEISSWYAESAAWASENGVFVGYEDGSFRGEQIITREQLAAVLYRYAAVMGYNVSASADLDAYDDGTLVSGYASEAMAWAVESGIIQGIGSNKLDPTGSATRAQLATMLMRFDELIKDNV